MNRQEKITQNYFNLRAKDWSVSSYKQMNEYVQYPSSAVRDSIVLSEIDKLKKPLRILDLGCGAGQMVIELLKRGHTVIGVDNAEAMIKVAKKNAKAAGFNEEYFKIADIKEVTPEVYGTFDVIVATGVIEYLNSDKFFLKKVGSLLKRNGHAFISCRNRFLNLVSGNDYTLSEIKKGNMLRLMKEHAEASKYSPLTIKESNALQHKVYAEIASFFENQNKHKSASRKLKKYTPFPVDLKRIFHTPNELDRIAHTNGMKLDYAVYFHLHPFASMYQQQFSFVYNQISLLMQPLGYTPLGSSLASGFVAILQKSK